MSQNQTRVDKTEGQSQRPSRSTSHRGFSGGGGGRGGRGGGGAQPPLSSNPSASLSFKKSGNGQSRPTGTSVSSTVLNGNHGHVSSHVGSSELLAQSAVAKPVDTSGQRNSRAIPKAPSSQSSQSVGGSLNTDVPSTPPKVILPSGDASRGAFPLQFGSISPGIMNGTQIPARTSSAPPNMDEQKRAQARHESFRAKPTMPTSSAPKQQQQQTGKDVNGLNQSSIGESHLLVQTKRDVRLPISSSSSAILQKSSVLPIGGMARHTPFQQTQVPMQFGGPNPQMQSQVVASNPLQMTMTLPMINVPQVPQHMFVPNFQSHPLQPQTMMHQGQGLGFTPQIGHQLPPQLGNLGFGIAPQFSQPQHVKFIGPRKTTVKITHPDTHEELRLDRRTDSHMDTGASRQRPLPNITPQSQTIQNCSSSHQINYYPTLQPNTYNTPPMFCPTSNSQLSMSSHGPRYSYPVGQSGQTISFMNPSPASGSKPRLPPSLHGVSGGANVEPLQVSATSAPIHPTIRPAINLSALRAVIPSVTINKDSNKSEPPNLLNSQVDVCGSLQKKDGEIDQKPQSVEPRDNTSLSVSGRHSSTAPSLISAQRIESGTSLSPHRTPVGESRSIRTGFEGCKEEPIQRSDSMNEHQEKTSQTEHYQQQNQTDVRDAAGIKKVSSKIINDAKDIIGQETAEASEKFQSLSGPDCSTISSLPSPTVEHDGSTEHRTFVAVNAKAAPSVCGSSGITVEKEVSQDSSLGSVSLELATSSYSSDERDSLEASTSLCSTVEQTVPEISNSSCLHEHKLGEAEQVQESLTSMEHCITEVPSNFLQNSDSDRSYPVPSMTPSQSVSAIASTGQEVNKVENSKEAGICVLSHGDEKIQNKKGIYCGLEVVAGGRKVDVPSPSSNFEDTGFPLLSFNSGEQDPSYPDAIVNKSEITGSQDVGPSDLGTSVTKLAPCPNSASESKQVCDGNVTELSLGEPVSVMLSGSKDNPISEPATAKTNVGKTKKMEGILSKADAAGASDLYNAYKCPEEKQETANALENIDLSLTVDAKHMVANDHKDDVSGEEFPPSKAEIDDWEDEADVSTPLLRTLKNNQQTHGNEAGSRRYSRDFLLAFSEQCVDLPVGFDIGSDIADALMIIPVGTHIFNHESYPSPGRMPDRSPGASWADRHMVGDDNKWTKVAGSSGTGRDIRPDMNYGSANISFRPGQGVNRAAIRNSHSQSSNYYASGILPGPMHSQSSQGVPRNNADADRWQRSPGVQRGLVPSPHMPSQVMHKAARKYEIGKVSDLEEAKQRQLKAILNKLTPQNFEKLFLKVKEVNIDNTITLSGVISQIFDKALMEPTFCEMYANFCVCLSNELPDFSEDNEKITFKRLLLNKCQEEFERDEREQAEANRTEEVGEIKQTEVEREETRIQVRRRMLGNIRLIGELYKKRMLTERIMHECIKKLLGESKDPDEEDLEALCKLMSTIGVMIDHAKAKGHMDAYFNRLLELSTSQKLSSRVRFMLRDAIDLRKNDWQQRRKVEGPKKIDEVHRDAAQERQAQAGRLARGPVITSGPRRGPTVDYSHRGSAVLSSPNSQQIGGTRGLPSHFRRPATQDTRMEDRNHFESRVLSVPLPQRNIDNSSITLGPQGGLARGMSIRGQPLISSIPSSDNSLNVGGPRRLASGPNGYSSIPREESVPRYMQDKFSGVPYDPQSPQDISFGSRDSQIADRVIDRFAATTPSGSVDGSSTGILVSSSESKPLSEATLREKSVSTIREFYSAKDEEEVALCIKELNSPSFYPSMISMWVTDSFERKEMERDILAGLLVNLCKCQYSLFSQTQLMEGFESVLSLLEDAVNDAPKAAEFLGHIFAKVTLDDVLPLSEIERLVFEGGEDPGSLVESGLASEVLGSILEFIRAKKGDSVFNNIRVNSKLRLEDFLPPHPTKTNRLHAFL